MQPSSAGQPVGLILRTSQRPVRHVGGSLASIAEASKPSAASFFRLGRLGPSEENAAARYSWSSMLEFNDGMTETRKPERTANGDINRRWIYNKLVDDFA